MLLLQYILAHVVVNYEILEVYIGIDIENLIFGMLHRIFMFTLTFKSIVKKTTKLS